MNMSTVIIDNFFMLKLNTSDPAIDWPEIHSAKCEHVICIVKFCDISILTYGRHVSIFLCNSNLQRQDTDTGCFMTFINLYLPNLLYIDDMKGALLSEYFFIVYIFGPILYIHIKGEGQLCLLRASVWALFGHIVVRGSLIEGWFLAAFLLKAKFQTQPRLWASEKSVHEGHGRSAVSPEPAHQNTQEVRGGCKRGWLLPVSVSNATYFSLLMKHMNLYKSNSTIRFWFQ